MTDNVEASFKILNLRKYLSRSQHSLKEKSYKKDFGAKPDFHITKNKEQVLVNPI